jgi:hypothetical protein
MGNTVRGECSRSATNSPFTEDYCFFRSGNIGPAMIGSGLEMKRKQLRLAWNYAGWGLGMALFGLILVLTR